jgi:hypothetical protein
MSTLRTDTLTNAAGTKSVPVATVVDGSAKAWVNFNGTGTVAIRAGFNVSSITDNGVGDYTANFTAAFADANYGFAGASSSSSTVFSSLATASRTASAHRINTKNTNNGVNQDETDVSLSYFR